MSYGNPAVVWNECKYLPGYISLCVEVTVTNIKNLPCLLVMFTYAHYSSFK